MATEELKELQYRRAHKYSLAFERSRMAGSSEEAENDEHCEGYEAVGKKGIDLDTVVIVSSLAICVAITIFSLMFYVRFSMAITGR